MVTKRLHNGKNRCPSLAGSLGKLVSASVAITTLAALAAFCFVTYRVQIEERRNNLQAIAATVGKLIERPISLGDYGLVESYLSGKNLPNFVEAFAVTGSAGVLLAGQDFVKAGGQHCSLTQTVTIPVGQSNAALADAPTLTMRAGFCDIRANAISFSVGAVGIAFFLVLIISVVSRFAVKRALRPLAHSVRAVSSQDDISAEFVERAPEEIRPLLSRLGQLYGDYLKVEASAKVGELAEQIAHDIRSPLTSLRSMANHAASLPADQKRTLLSVIDRITDIANGLLKTKKRDSLATHQDANEIYLVNDVIEGLISEKRAQYRSRTNVRIESVIADGTSGVFAGASRAEFQSVLSNLIDNAFEAIDGDGSITILLAEPSESRFSVEIRDSGRGIPQEQMNRLGEKGFTFGKEGGSGLGLYGAKRFTDSVGGSLEISSTVEQGTSVAVSLPLLLPPSWYLQKISLVPDTKIIVVDDDSSIFDVWQDRFSRAGLAPEKLRHVRCRSELERVVSALKTDEPILFLLDFDLGDESDDGLQLATLIPSGATKALITSHYDNGVVRARAEEAGVKILPKQLVPFVPIELAGGDLDCVLIDDDSIVHMVWKLSAKTFGKRIRIFQDPPSDDELNSIPHGTPIYVDQNLRNGIRGTEVSKRLFEKGYRNLVLASGFDRLQDETIPWVRQVTMAKEPPWEKLIECNRSLRELRSES